MLQIVTEVFQPFSHILEDGTSVRSTEEFFEVFLDRLGVHWLRSEDQLLDPIFLFQLLRPCRLVRGDGLASLDIIRIIRDRRSSSLRVAALQPLCQKVSEQFCVVEASDGGPKLSLQEISPVLDLLGGDTRIGLGLMKPSEMENPAVT